VSGSEPRGYLICSEPRSGTTLLGRLLVSTGVLGDPREYFNAGGAVARGIAGYGPSLMTPTVLDLGGTANGVYAAKVFSEHFAAPDPGWIERLPNVRFVHFERVDVLGQAISLARAIQTGQYKSTDQRTGEAGYDRALIASCLLSVAWGQTRWRLFFARNGISPLRLTYEELLEDPAQVVGRIARLMEVPEATIDPAVRAPDMQRDALSAEWRERFIRDGGDLDRLDKLEMSAALRVSNYIGRARRKLARLAPPRQP
jgi:trehalose 2-sulfotransferase